MRYGSRVVCVLAAVCALTRAPLCQETAPASRWDFSVAALAATGEENTNSLAEAQVVSALASIARTITRNPGAGWLSGSLEYQFSLAPMFVQFRPKNRHGIAFEPVAFRWNSNHRLRGMTPYIELAGGGVHTNLNIPPGPTSNFNFTAKGGGGFYLHRTPTHALDMGIRYSHLSNAYLGVVNPAFNGIELRVAYHWFR